MKQSCLTPHDHCPSLGPVSMLVGTESERFQEGRSDHPLIFKLDIPNRLKQQVLELWWSYEEMQLLATNCRPWRKEIMLKHNIHPAAQQRESRLPFTKVDSHIQKSLRRNVDFRYMGLKFSKSVCSLGLTVQHYFILNYYILLVVWFCLV